MRHSRESLLGFLVVAVAACGGSALQPPKSSEPPPPAARPTGGPAGDATAPTITTTAPVSNFAPTEPAPATITSSVHVALGIPRDGDDTDDYVMDKGAYVVSYNSKRNAANWVAWQLDEKYLGAEDRQNDFRADDALPTAMYHATPKDFAHSGFDQGHLCPSADRTRTATENSLTFLMTNMHAQRPELNRVTWKALEVYERALAKQHRELYIVAGGLFDATPSTIGHGVAVPKASYKIVVVIDAGQGVESVTTATDVIAVLMPNDPTVKEKKWTAYVTTVDEIERQSGYDFLTKVPESVQKVIESRATSIR